MSVVVPARFVVHIWAPKREKCGGLREYDDEQAHIWTLDAAVGVIRHLEGDANMSDGLAPFLQDLGDTRKPGEIRMTKSRGLERLFIPEVVDQTYSPDMPCRSHP
jgi:hypothetical protein